MGNLMLDSSAPTLYNTYARKDEKYKNLKVMGAHIKDREVDDYSWISSPEFLAYREKYIEWIKQHESKITIYSNLDIINNPQATWRNQQYLESKGLKPIPVWHFGSHVKWFKHYLDKGYDYIAIGGLVPNPYETIRPALDELFSKYICDSDGIPKVKIHGFAATSIKLLTRYPFYSVDSASWIKIASYGTILVPIWRNGNYCYTEVPYKINVSPKSSTTKEAGRHFTTLTPNMQKYVLDYLAKEGFGMGRSKLLNGEESVIIPGVSNRAEQRAFLNAKYYLGLRDSLPKWPWAFKLQEVSL